MKTRRRIGASLIGACALVLTVHAHGGDKQGGEYAIVAGTVFREPGFALPGAEVALAVRIAPQGIKAPKPQRVIANERGEFLFRVPPVKAEYMIRVKAAGFAAQEKPAVISGGPERQDIYFELKRESK